MRSVIEKQFETSKMKYRFMWFFLCARDKFANSVCTTNGQTNAEPITPPVFVPFSPEQRKNIIINVSISDASNGFVHHIDYYE